MFLQTVHDIGTHVVAFGEFSLEFIKQGVFLFVFIRFWSKDGLCRVFLKRNSRVLGQSAADLSQVSIIMAIFCTRPTFVSCSACSLETIQITHESSFSKHGLQRRPRFDDFFIARLMHKKSYSIFGRIDFHSVLQYLIIFLGGTLDCEWTPRNDGSKEASKLLSSP